uniref:Protein kinase domain-containing protein n=1 Tax=Oryza barthii TaxID=65489 RepID=A0A0D3ESX3_9ORYZ
MDAAAVMQKQLRRLRTLGRGASGAVVWLASDDASGELLAVKSAAGEGGAELLRREGRVMSGLCSPHIVPCLGSRTAAGGEYQLFLEFAPGGSLADEAARSGGRLAERAIRAFGCARRTDSERPIGGTPAFMAPEVARGEEQGPAADVWALGCTIIEMATGRVPWSDMDDVFSAVHRIGYTDAVPEIPEWLSPEAKNFLSRCFTRNPSDRPTAAQLLEHPFLASASSDIDETAPKHGWVSPKSTLNAECWESDEDDEVEEGMSQSATKRISALAITCSALPDWDSEDGWIDLQSDPSEVSETPAPMVVTTADFGLWWEEALDAEIDLHFVDVDGDGYVTRTVRARGFIEYDRQLSVRVRGDMPLCPVDCHRSDTVKFGCHCNGNRVINFESAQICLLLPFILQSRAHRLHSVELPPTLEDCIVKCPIGFAATAGLSLGSPQPDYSHTCDTYVSYPSCVVHASMGTIGDGQREESERHREDMEDQELRICSAQSRFRTCCTRSAGPYKYTFPPPHHTPHTDSIRTRQEKKKKQREKNSKDQEIEAMAKQLRRVRTLGRGASGAVVWLASDDDSGELMAVKSASAGGAAAQLRREGRVLSGLCSPHIVPCLGSRAAAGGEYQLFLEFAPGGSLADEAARNGGCLPEPAIRAYAADVARGLAYLHGNSLVHGDVKARNVRRPGEAHGLAADVWALGCTIIEMATGRAPWSDMDDILAAVHRIGYTNAVPEVPGWLSAEAKDFLDGCFERNASDRSTAAQLLEHPFVASAAALDRWPEPAKQERASPKSTLHDAFWDSDTDDEDDEMPTGAAERIGALACAASALPDWDSDEGWIEVHNEGSFAAVTPPASDADYFVWAELSDPEMEQFAVAADGVNHVPRNEAEAIESSIRQGSYLHVHLGSGKNEIFHPFDTDGTESGLDAHRLTALQKHQWNLSSRLPHSSWIDRTFGSDLDIGVQLATTC